MPLGGGDRAHGRPDGRLRDVVVHRAHRHRVEVLNVFGLEIFLCKSILQFVKKSKNVCHIVKTSFI